MRPREEFEKNINQRPPKDMGAGDELILEVLLDIRALLLDNTTKKTED